MNTSAARGLIKRVKARKEPPKSRDLVGRCGGYAGDGWPSGLCRWCARECGARNKWHKNCVRAYSAARGLVVETNTTILLIQRAECAQCGEFDAGMEIDHRLALGIARRQGPREWIRAWWIGNLQWLCGECHRVKTREDRTKMRILDSAQLVLL